jgi:SAM-dependent methyltransferase
MSDDLPHYCLKIDVRAPRAAGFARQILRTVQPFLRIPVEQLCVLDVGCGYGYTSIELARICQQVVGIDPSHTMIEYALSFKKNAGLKNVEFDCLPADVLPVDPCYDLVVLDNVLEHIPNQAEVLRRISQVLKPGGVVFILVPNKLWPMEVHYNLPFLSYLPLRLANLYLRITGRGSDYSDASFAPTYFGLNRLLRNCKGVSFRYVLPADVSLATMGQSLHYRIGVAAIRYCPLLWIVSKMLLVVGVAGDQKAKSTVPSGEIVTHEKYHDSQLNH